jgi:hypothetical protein
MCTSWIHEQNVCRDYYYFEQYVDRLVIFFFSSWYRRGVGTKHIYVNVLKLQTKKFYQQLQPAPYAALRSE